MPPATVERIAHYRILHRVGRGGMGVVYKAVDERDGRTVALKVIRETETSRTEDAPHLAEARVRFTREAEILKSLLHVNIVSFFEIGEDDGTPYLAMEFLDGVSIGAYAGRPYQESLPLLIQAAHGLEVLASRGIVHRDLSPDNVFVVDSGGEKIVKLLDFGIAKMFESRPAQSLTATGFFLGKVAYGSPEQLGYMGPGADVDWLSDVYSLGVIFFEVLSGHRPFEGKAPVEYIAAHLNHAPPPVAAPAGMPALPMDLVRLIGRMLEKKRENRPQTYREIVDGLVSALRSGGTVKLSGVTALAESERVTETQATSLVAGGQTPGAMGREERRRLVLTAAALLVLAGATVWLGYRAFGPPGESKQGEFPDTREGSEIKPDGSVSGTLQVLATPYASIVSITEEDSRRPLALPSGATTPMLLAPIPAGRYRVVLKCAAAGGKQVERVVAVRAGRPALVAESFLSPQELVKSLE